MTNGSISPSDDPLVILRDLLITHFDNSELRHLCFEMKIDYESLSGPNKNDKALELVLYCQRRGLLPELFQEIKRSRPELSPPAELGSYIDSLRIERLERSAWLHARGFLIDPFSKEAFRAEDDPLFEKSGLPAFVELFNYESLRGTLTSPGYRFIFAPTGAGKTSLRRRIVYELDDGLAKSTFGPSLLAVEYIDHDYSPYQADTRSHVLRIAHLVANKLKSVYQIDIAIPSEQSSQSVLESLLTQVQDLGLDGIYILVDNLDIQTFPSPITTLNLIWSLATRTDLMSINGLVFKFLLPIEVLSLAHQIIAPEFIHAVKWRKEELTKVLHARLLACMETDDTAKFPDIATALAGICEPQHASRIANTLIEWGHNLGQPRDLWRLGDYLLEGHFNQASDSHRLETDLIQYETLYAAFKQFTEDEYLRWSLTSISKPPIEIIEQARIADALEKAVYFLDRLGAVEYSPMSIVAKETTLIQELSQQYIAIARAIERLGVGLESLTQTLQGMTDPNKASGSAVTSSDMDDVEQDNWKKEVETLLGQNYQYEKVFNLIRINGNRSIGIMLRGQWSRIESDYSQGIITRDEYYARLGELDKRVIEMLKEM